MSEDEIIKYIKNEIEIDIDTRNSFKDNKESPVYKDLDEYIKAHQGLLDLYQQEKEKNKELEEKLKISKQLYNDSCICIATECVEKDKIKAKIEYLDNQQRQWLEDRELKNSDEEICFARDFLIKLLKEEK